MGIIGKLVITALLDVAKIKKKFREVDKVSLLLYWVAAYAAGRASVCISGQEQHVSLHIHRWSFYASEHIRVGFRNDTVTPLSSGRGRK